jgi:hypothetical protein
MQQTCVVGRFLTVGVLAVLFTGCYVSPVPMSEQRLPIDKRLLGSWVDKEEDTRYHVEKADGRNYAITMEAFDDDTERWEKRQIPGFLTQVGDLQVLNLWLEADEGEDEEEEGYVFLKYLVREGDEPEILFWVMGETLFKDDNNEVRTFDKSKKLQKFTRRLLSDPELWMDEPTVLTPFQKE